MKAQKKLAGMPKRRPLHETVEGAELKRLVAKVAMEAVRAGYDPEEAVAAALVEVEEARRREERAGDQVRKAEP